MIFNRIAFYLSNSLPGGAAHRTRCMTAAPRPLDGIRVLDLTNVLAGPFACHQLAHLGAEVIKVEAPNGGDLARQLGADPELNRRHMGVSFLAQNAGKRSIALDLKKPAGKAVLQRLVAGADVLVENFRPGVMQRLGLDYEALLAHNPRLVYCAISGFGQDGPLRDLPAYDQIIQGMAGVMSITGDPQSAPLRVGFPVADTIGGLTAAMAVCAALAERDRRGGRFIDVSMLEAVIATMGWAVSNLLIAGRAATWRTLTHIVLPLLKPAIVATFVFSFTHAMTAVSAVIFLATAKYNLSTVYIIGRVEAGEYPLAIAYSMVLLLFMLSVLLLVQRSTGAARLGRRGHPHPLIVTGA